MAIDYSEKRATAERLIKLFGKAGTVTKLGVTGGFDAWDNPIADMPAVVIDGIITPRLDAKIAEIDNTNILASDGFCFFHSDVEPEIGMQTTLNGITYKIVNIKKLDSVGDINVYRKLQLRAG